MVDMATSVLSFPRQANAIMKVDLAASALQPEKALSLPLL